MDGKKLLKYSKWLIFILLLTIVLRIPSLFEPYWYGDEGVYLTLGMALRKGLVFYRDIHDNKPPLLYLMAAIAHSQVWLRFILLWWNLINVYLIYLLSKKIFNKERLALASSLLFLFFSLVPEGNIANGEIFMIMPATAAMLLLYQGLKVTLRQAQAFGSEASKVKSYFISGVLFSIAFLFKVPAALSFVAAITFLIFFSNPKKIFNFKSNFLNLIFGFISLPLLTFIYFGFRGGLPQYWTATFRENFGYLSSWGGGWNKSLISLTSGFTQRSLLLAAILVGFYLFKKRLSKDFLFIILWFLFDLFGAFLSGRPYPHYLIQVAPSLSILLVFPLTKQKIVEKLFALSAFGILIFSVYYYKFWRYPVLKYYQNFYQFITGQKTKAEYFSFFDSRVNETYQLVRIIKSLTRPGDYLFIWGNEPYLYAMADRLPTGRYIVAYHIVDFNGWQETASAIAQKQPTLIITIKSEKEFKQLNEILAENYLKMVTLERSIVFKKI